MLTAYVTGHGYGHATRTAEVLRHVRGLRPELPISIVTAAPERLFRSEVAPPLAYRELTCDVGVVQQGALRMDPSATADAWERFEADRPQLVTREADRLLASGTRVVLADIPPLAFEAAARAGIPAVGLTNFSWDWIWRHLARTEPRLGRAAERAAEAYSTAALLLRLPFAGELRAFGRQEAIPLVARRPGRDRDGVRAALGLPADGRRVLLLSFGGFGLEALDLARFGALDGWRVLALAAAHADGPHAANVTTFTNEHLDRLEIRYADLVGATDVVVTKPGYGIVTDCIGAGARLLYTDRGDFPEYPVMVHEMPRYLPCLHVAHDALFEARLAGPLGALMAQPWPDPPRLDGAEVAARRLVETARL